LSFFCASAAEERTKSDREVAQEAAPCGGLSASPGSSFFVATFESSADRRHRQSRSNGRFPLVAPLRKGERIGFVAEQKYASCPAEIEGFESIWPIVE